MYNLMMNDPSIINVTDGNASAGSKNFSSRYTPRISFLAPFLRVLTETNETANNAEGADEESHIQPDKSVLNENVNYATSIVVRCSDKGVIFPRSALIKMPFGAIPADTNEIPFKYSFSALNALYQWCEKYGKDGRSPINLSDVKKFIDFTGLIRLSAPTETFEDHFYKEVLNSNDSVNVPSDTVVQTIKAAEEYKMEGLLDFAVSVLSCTIRRNFPQEVSFATFGTEENKVDQESGNDVPIPISAEERKLVEEEYPWLKEITEPKN